MLAAVNVLYFKNISVILYGIGLIITFGIFAGIYTTTKDFKLEYYLFLLGMLAYQFVLNSEIAITFYILKTDYEFYTTKLWHLHLETYYFIRCVFLKHNKPVINRPRPSEQIREAEASDQKYYKMLVQHFNKEDETINDNMATSNNATLVIEEDD